MEGNEIPSMAESLDAAITSVESGTPPPATPADATPTPTDKNRGADGRFANTANEQRVQGAPAAAPVPTPTPGPAAPNPVAAGQAAAPLPGAVATPPADVAPQSWKDTAKAKWAALDPEVKAEIGRRERDMNIGLQRAAEGRKFGDSVQRTLAPYMGILQAEGASPEQAIQTLFETAMTLRYGSPEHKRALMISMIQQYGVDLTQQLNPEVARMQRELDMHRYQQHVAQTEQQFMMQHHAQSEVATFEQQPGHEHLDTLREGMAMLLTSGQASTLQEAYDKAAWMHPQVRSFMQQQAAVQQQQDQQRNRLAASGISGGPGAASSTPAVDPQNLRASLEAAFSSTSGRI